MIIIITMIRDIIIIIKMVRRSVALKTAERKSLRRRTDKDDCLDNNKSTDEAKSEIGQIKSTQNQQIVINKDK